MVFVLGLVVELEDRCMVMSNWESVLKGGLWVMNQ